MLTHGDAHAGGHTRNRLGFPQWTVLMVALLLVALLPFVGNAEIPAGGRAGRL